MRINTKIIALMTALAAGGAYAAAPVASANTVAGTPITNTATASFTDPSSNTTATANSNTVSTSVLPIYGFNVTYADGTADSATTSTLSGAPASYTTANQTVGSTVTFKYAVVNNGNAPQTVNLTTAVSGVDANTVKYYPAKADGTINTAAAITSVAVDAAAPDGTGAVPTAGAANSGVTYFYVQYTVPSLSAGTAAGETPIGTGYSGASTLDSNNRPVPPTTTVTESSSALFQQFNKVTTYDPALNNQPSQAATSTVNTPPGAAGSTGYPGTTAGTGTGAPAGGGTVPGTTPTPIVVSGNQQIAYPPSDSDATASNPDVVVFTNTLTNGGTASDVLTLAPGVISGTTATDSNNVVWTKAGIGTWTSRDANGATVTVQFLDPATKTPIDTVTIDPSKSKTANYLTQVTYPDSNSVTSPPVVKVEVTASSANNPTASSKTTDIIYPGNASFGDTAAVAQTGGVKEDPSKAYYPNGSTTVVNTAPGASASYGMSVSNTGQYNDTFNLSGAVPIKLTDGTTSVYAVQYVGATISPNFTGNVAAPLSTASSAGTAPIVVNGTTYYAPIYTTPTVNSGATTGTAVTAKVAVPANAAMTTGAAGTNPEPKLQQTASSVYSAANGGSLVMSDTNNPLAISALGSVYVAKFTKDSAASPAAANAMYVKSDQTCVSGAPTDTAVTSSQIGNPAGYTCAATSYLPNTAYSYQIVGKNTYNADISNFVLQDDLTGKPFRAVAVADITCSTGGTASIASNVAKCSYFTLATLKSATMTVNVTIK